MTSDQVPVSGGGPSEADRGAGAPLQASDKGSFELSWDKRTVPLEGIERALYALADQVSGAVSDAGSSWLLTAYPRGPKTDASLLQHLLRQEVIDQSLRVKIAERTDPVRNLVFALAFSRTGLVEEQPDP